MIEPRRADPDAAEHAERDSQTDALLVAGLDRYFAGRYEEAIHLWTRVLFLDRSHARARAYIDRARTAIAEQQRRAEAMLASSRELLAQGDTTAARSLLREAVATSGDDEHAAALRLQLERVERARSAAPARAATPSPRPAVDGWHWPRRSPVVTTALVVVAVTITLVVALASPLVREFVAMGRSGAPLPAGPAATPLTVLSSADVALVRARALYRRGRLAEALAALDRIGPDSPARPSADQLRIQIQHVLLESGRPLPPGDAAAGAVRR